MKNTSKSSKLLSFIMAFLILLVSLPTYALASLAPEETSQGLNETQTTALPEEEGVYVLEEDISLREENVKHFKLSNGTVKAVSYANAVHYLDAEGNWIDIDNSLTLNGSEYTANNKQEIKFANKSGSNGLLSIKDGEYKIDFTPLNTNKVSVEIENPQENNSRKFDDVKNLNNIVSRATYKGIYEGIDLEYILVGNNIKENIIVNKKQEEYTYSFEIKLSKLNATLENNMVVLTDSDTGEKVYEIPSPYMVDANGEYSDKVEYTLTKDSKWKYTFTVKADPEWINEEERQLPVKIDPTVIVNSNITDINATFEYTKSNGEITSTTVDITDNGALIVGNFVNYLYDSVAFMKFNSLPELPAGTKLMSANVEFYVYNYLNDTDLDGLNLGIYQAMADWTSFTDRTISGNYSMFNDYCNTNSAVVSGTINGNGIYSFNITDLYSSWKYGTANNGFCLKGMNLPQNDNNSSTYEDLAAYIVASNGINGYVSPSLEVSYTHLIGVEDYYAYAENTLGDVGKSYVNLYNGSLTYINNLTSIEVGPNLTYDIDMVYNSIEKIWTPSFAECIMPYNDDGSVLYEYISTGERYGIERYLWRDPDGTLHAFTPHLEKNAYGAYLQSEYLPDGTTQGVIDPTVFYPEDDIDYVLIQTENNEFILRDYNGNQKMFDSQGRLSKICDAQGNMLHFSYVSNKLSLIDLKTSNDKFSTQLRITYDENNRIEYIYNFETKLETTITWENDSSKFEYNFKNAQIHNTVDVEFISNTDYTIDSISDSATSKMVEYIVNSQDKIATINEHINVSQIQNNINYYSEETGDYTIITDEGTNFSSNLDNIRKKYKFDERGRKIDLSVGNSVSEYFSLISTYEYENDLFPNSVYYIISYSDKINDELYGYSYNSNIIRHDIKTGRNDYLNISVSTEANEISETNELTLIDANDELTVELNNEIEESTMELIQNPLEYPYSAVCYISSRFGDIYRRATGFLIGPNLLMTAGHCIYGDKTKDGIVNPTFPDEIIIYPGGYEDENGDITSSYGTAKVEIAYLQEDFYDYTNENSSIDMADFDWSLCVLDNDIGYETGWFDIAIASSNIANERICVVGYPDIDTRNMYMYTGTILQVKTYYFSYNTETVDGVSGSPVFLDNDSTYSILGIHSNDENAIRINELIFTFSTNLRI